MKAVVAFCQSRDKLEKTRIVEGFLDEMMIIPRKDILRVYILTDNVFLSSRITGGGIDEKTGFKDFPWYKQALESRNAVFIPVHSEPFDKQGLKTFSIVQQLRSTKDSNKILGVIKVDANYNGIQTICSRARIGNEGALFIIDPNKNLIYNNSSKNINIDRIYSEIYDQMTSGNKRSFSSIELDGRQFLLNYTPIQSSNWIIVAINSLNELNDKAAQTRNNAFLMAITSAVITLLILILFIKKFLAPLLGIVKLMKEVKNGDLSVRFADGGNDEIGYLGASFNLMINRINEMLFENTRLLKEVYESKLLQKEAQLSALYSQIRPHFIYNTLNMISLLIQSGRHNDAVGNINRLSFILRAMANMDKETTLKAEIELLKSYLQIQCSRYDDRLGFSINIDEAAYSLSLPSFTFQPIVENAVIHGCEAKRKKTFIKIYDYKDEQNIVFTIEDDGAGMHPEELRLLRQKLEDPDGTTGTEAGDTVPGKGIGLVNVNKRLKIKFGQEYGIKIDSKLGEGTSVRIILPAKSMKAGVFSNV